jgi:hypothetical protein
MLMLPAYSWIGRSSHALESEQKSLLSLANIFRLCLHFLLLVYLVILIDIQIGHRIKDLPRKNYGILTSVRTRYLRVGML